MNTIFFLSNVSLIAAVFQLEILNCATSFLVPVPVTTTSISSEDFLSTRYKKRPIVTTTDGTYRSQIAVAKKRSSRDEKENDTNRQDEKESSEWTSSCSTKSHRRGKSCHKCRDIVKHLNPSGLSRWPGWILGNFYFWPRSIFSYYFDFDGRRNIRYVRFKTWYSWVSAMKFILYGMIYAI